MERLGLGWSCGECFCKRKKIFFFKYEENNNIVCFKEKWCVCR
eukprot:UN01539